MLSQRSDHSALATAPCADFILTREWLKWLHSDGGASCPNLSTPRSESSLFSGPGPECHRLERDGDDPGLAESGGEGFSLARIKGRPDLGLLGRQTEV